MLSTRNATTADIPFLASMMHAACTPPHQPPDHVCEFGHLLAGRTGSSTSNTSVEALFAGLLHSRASGWGQVEDFVLLERDGVPVGAGACYAPLTGPSGPDAGYPVRVHTPDAMDALASHMGWDHDNLTVFTKRLHATFPAAVVADTLGPLGERHLEYVAVAPAARGQGAGRALLHELLERARMAGATRVGLTVENGNTAATGFYTALGFEVAAHFGSSYYAAHYPGFAGITRYVREL